MPIPRRAESENALRELLAWWQRELGLLDWEIRVLLRSRAWLTDKHGEVRMQVRKKIAAIFILDPAEWSADEFNECDPELTLVHELLHVRFPAFYGRKDSHKEITSEQAVHALSQTLVRMSRRRRKKPTCSLPTDPSLRKRTS